MKIAFMFVLVLIGLGAFGAWFAAVVLGTSAIHQILAAVYALVMAVSIIGVRILFDD